MKKEQLRKGEKDERFMNAGLNFKNILTAFLVITFLFAVCTLLISHFQNPMESVSPTVFSKGALNDVGEYVASETQLYTKELIECQGLTIKQDFESGATYEVYYYRADKTFIGKTGTLKGEYQKYDYENAKYARIVLTPQIKDGKDKIQYLQILSYAREIEVSVYKDQTFEPASVQIFEDIETTYFASPTAFDNGYTVVSNDAPFVMSQLTAFENRTVTKIGVPISLVKDTTEDSVFTVYVVEGDGKSDFKNIKAIKLIIPANTLTERGKVSENEIEDVLADREPGEYSSVHFGYSKVQEWYHFDVEITLTKGQTLGFASTDDTVCFAYNRAESGTDDNYKCYNTLFNSPGTPESVRIYFDVWCLE